MSWRYFAQRLTGRPENDEILDLDLPLQEVKITEVLSGPDRLQAKIAPKVARLIQPDGRPLLQKWNTAIHAEGPDGVHSFILDSCPINGATMNLTGIGYSGYPQGQPYTGSWSGVEVDPLDVVRQAWDHLQTSYNGNLGMEISDAKSPIRIGIKKSLRVLDPQDDPNVGPSYFESGPARLAWYETDDIGAYLDQLASDTPFDYGETHWWDGETLRHRLDLYYPRRGWRRDDLRFVVGENITVIPAVSDDEYATEVLALGAGEGRAMLRAIQSRPWAGLRRATTVVDKSARTMASVNGLARRELAWRVGLDDIAEVILEDSESAPLEKISVGDEIYLKGRTEWSEIGHWVRILDKEISPEDRDVLKLTTVRSDKLGDPHPYLNPIADDPRWKPEEAPPRVPVPPAFVSGSMRAGNGSGLSWPPGTLEDDLVLLTTLGGWSGGVTVTDPRLTKIGETSLYTRPVTVWAGYASDLATPLACSISKASGSTSELAIISASTWRGVDNQRLLYKPTAIKGPINHDGSTTAIIPGPDDEDLSGAIMVYATAGGIGGAYGDQDWNKATSYVLKVAHDDAYIEIDYALSTTVPIPDAVTPNTDTGDLCCAFVIGVQ